MADRRRRLIGLSVVGIAAVALVVVGAIVLAANDSDDACQTPEAAPPAETALMPDGLSFDQIGTVTGVQKDERNVVVQAVTTKPIDARLEESDCEGRWDIDLVLLDRDAAP